MPVNLKSTVAVHHGHTVTAQCVLTFSWVRCLSRRYTTARLLFCSRLHFLFKECMYRPVYIMFDHSVVWFILFSLFFSNRSVYRFIGFQLGFHQSLSPFDKFPSGFFFFNSADKWRLSYFSVLLENRICFLYDASHGTRMLQDRHAFAPSYFLSVFLTP